LNLSQGYQAVFPPLNAATVEPLLRPAFKAGAESDIKVLAASPVEGDLRMFVQQGQFTVHVIDEPLNLMPGSDKWIRKFVIPTQAILDMALQLDVLGMRLADLFPDLQNLAKEISNVHQPSPPPA
jgi:hypothetical protein